jgi:hypothetical protein
MHFAYKYKRMLRVASESHWWLTCGFVTYGNGFVASGDYNTYSVLAVVTDLEEEDADLDDHEASDSDQDLQVMDSVPDEDSDKIGYAEIEDGSADDDDRASL